MRSTTLKAVLKTANCRQKEGVVDTEVIGEYALDLRDDIRSVIYVNPNVPTNFPLARDFLQGGGVPSSPRRDRPIGIRG